MKKISPLWRYLPWFPVLLLVSCATNNYLNFYRTSANRSFGDVVPLAEGQEPKIYTSANLNSDALDVISNHYVLVGTSSFNGPLGSLEDVRAVCVKIGATLALVYSKYAETQHISGVIPWTTTTTSSDEWSTTVVTTTNFLPWGYDVRRYDQTALYFMKFTTKLKLGLAYDDLNSDLRMKFERNQGVIVKIVYKDSPAFNANLLVGDLIVEANGQEVRNRDQFGKMIADLPPTGQCDLKIIRHGDETELKIDY